MSNNIICRLFLGCKWGLNISTIILQSTCSNLEGFVRPLTILDNILSANVDEIPNNHKYVQVLKGLFDACLTGNGYNGNEYVWNIFNSFIYHKHQIRIDLDELEKKTCTEKSLLLCLLIPDIVKQSSDEDEYGSDKYNNKNLLKRDIFSIFRNSTNLVIICHSCPLSLDSLLSLIKGTQITEVEIYGKYWLNKAKEMASFDDISSDYEEANFNLQFAGHNNWKLFVTCNK